MAYDWMNIPEMLQTSEGGYWDNESGQVVGGNSVNNPLYTQMSSLPWLENLSRIEGGVIAPTTGQPMNGAIKVRGLDGREFNAFEAGNDPFQFNITPDGQLRSGSNQGDGTYFNAPISGFSKIGGEDYILTDPSKGLSNYNTYAPLEDEGFSGADLLPPAVKIAMAVSGGMSFFENGGFNSLFGDGITSSMGSAGSSVPESFLSSSSEFGGGNAWADWEDALRTISPQTSIDWSQIPQTSWATGDAIDAGGVLSGATSSNPLTDMLSKINSTLGMDKNPITMKDVLFGGANYLINNSLANKAREDAASLAKQGDSLNQPQRQPYQAMLSSLLSNPSEFYKTNPVVKANMDIAKQEFEANTGKFGTGGTQFANYLKNVQNNAASIFNDQANLLSGLGGFGFAPNGANAASNMLGRANTSQAEAFRGFGQNIFKQNGPQQAENTFGKSPFGNTVLI